MKQTTKAKQKARQSRRDFLGGVLAGGAATALLAVSGAVADTTIDAAEPSEAKDQKPRGYHVTPHIQTYYQKAQI